MATTEVVRERPILFSGPMIRALLAGQKTQTRRVAIGINPTLLASGATHEQIANAARCPYGQPGDRLWVREAWGQSARCRTLYRASEEEWRAVAKEEQWVSMPAWKPSIHMPRWASRITLELTDVRVERVQEISDDDCDAEGRPPITEFGTIGDLPVSEIEAEARAIYLRRCEWFPRLWDSINGPRGYGWDANPWVWALTFRVLTPQPPHGGEERAS
jgi:hypothetical protein